MRKFLFLNSAQRFSDFALLLLRVFVGLFLIWSVWHNVTDSTRMREFSSFLAKHRFPGPDILAPVMTFLELAIGTGFILGLFTRWAGILCAILFMAMIAMVDRFDGMGGVFPSGCLVVIGLYLATHGAGRISVDAALRANDPPRSNGGVRFQKLIAMARNIEIKARIESVALLTPRVAELASEGPIEIAQDDTFFNCVTGRLKLRAFSNDAGELIFYRRANQTGPKESFYLRSPTTSPETLRESLSLAYGQVGRVRKYRTLFLVGRTRVHLDRVEDLGHFLELEVMLVDDEPPEQGIREASDLMDRLGVQPSQLIEGADLDLLLAQQG